MDQQKTQEIKLSNFTNYIGDVNLEYGGLFINLEGFRHGYADCLRVTDLDSGCGFGGAVMVEHISVLIRKKQEVKAALQCCGLKKPTGQDAKTRKMCIIECLVSYGVYDTTEDFTGPYRWIIQTDPEGPQEYDGWKVDITLSEDQELFEYLLNDGFLSEFE